jgi:CRISPR system Cascade subunit CasE
MNDAPRDFLYREISGRRPSWLIVSARAPQDTLGLWRVESKPYAPAISDGQRLGFTLRANATLSRSKPVEGGEAGRHDVVMAAMKREKISREKAIDTAGRAWLDRQAARNGFAINAEALRIGAYTRHEFSRGSGRANVIATLDYDGLLTVTDAAKFRAALINGIGRGKAFGFGLLLIRRPGQSSGPSGDDDGELE